MPGRVEEWRPYGQRTRPNIIAQRTLMINQAREFYALEYWFASRPYRC